MISQSDLFPSVNKTAETVNASRKKMNGKPVYEVPSKTVLNLESHFKPKLLCDGMTFSAGSACVYRCAYCYVKDMMRKQTPFFEKNGIDGYGKKVKHGDVVIRRSGAVDILLKELHSPKATALAYERKVIYASPAVDVAGNMDLVDETIEMCRIILTQTRWDIRLLSKSNLLPKVAEGLVKSCEDRNPNWPHPAISDMKERMIFGVSTGTLDETIARAIEGGTPLVKKRIESLHWLQDNGYRTFGMICPSLPQVDYGQFARDMAKAIRADRCEHVWAEVINLRGDSFTATEAALLEHGCTTEARQSASVRTDLYPATWETYARATFEAHATTYAGQTGPDGKPKLRFLQYPLAGTTPWWAGQTKRGAILL